MSSWDTSALLKLYIREADSAAFIQLAGAARRIAVSAIARYEAETAFRRKEAEAPFSRAMRIFFRGSLMLIYNRGPWKACR